MPGMIPSRGCVALVGAQVRAWRDVPAPVRPVAAQDEPSPCMIPSRGCVDLAGAQADADCVHSLLFYNGEMTS